MPRITFRDYQSGTRPWWDYIQDAGGQLAGGVAAHHAEGVHRGELADEAARKDRALDIEETNAKARLLERANIAAAREAREKEQEVQKAEAIKGLTEIEAAQRRDKTEQAIQEAVKSPEGALGPFGILGTRFFARVAGGFQRVEDNMAPKIELAKEMSPAGAKAYLTKEAHAEKTRVTAEGYQKEADALGAAVKDGVIDAGQAREWLKPIHQSIQSIAKGGPPTVAPGATQQLIAKAYNLHTKIQQRLAVWGESDQKAGQIIATLQQLADQAEMPKIRDVLLAKVAAAKGEWGRTQFEDFRTKHDGPASVAGLEAIMFGAQAAAGEPPHGPYYPTGNVPPGFPTPDAETMRGMSAAQGAAARNETVTVRPRFAMADNSQRAQLAPGDGQGGKSAGGQPEARSTSREKPVARGEYRTITPESKAKVGAQIEGYVADNGAAALKQDADQASEIRKLRIGLAKDLGLDPRDPYVRGVITSALLKLREGQIGARAAAPKGQDNRAVGSMSRQEQLAAHPFQ